MSVVGKDADNFHSRLYLRVGLIDDAERRLGAWTAVEPKMAMTENMFALPQYVRFASPRATQLRRSEHIFGHGDFWFGAWTAVEPKLAMSENMFASPQLGRPRGLLDLLCQR